MNRYLPILAVLLLACHVDADPGTEGPAGPEGASGERGDAGATGPRGATGRLDASVVYIAKNATVIHEPGEDLLIQAAAYCDPGDVVLGGGCNNPSGTLSQSAPNRDAGPEGWACSGHGRDGEAMTVYVVCADSN